MATNNRSALSIFLYDGAPVRKAVTRPQARTFYNCTSDIENAFHTLLNTIFILMNCVLIFAGMTDQDKCVYLVTDDKIISTTASTLHNIIYTRFQHNCLVVPGVLLYAGRFPQQQC